MAGKKAFGSQSDKRTKAGRERHAQVDGVKMFDDTAKGIAGLFGGNKKKKSSKKESAHRKSAAENIREEKLSALDIQAEIQREEAVARQALIEKLAKEEAQRKAQEERQQILTSLSNIYFNNSKEEIVKSLDYIFSVIVSNKSTSIRISAVNKAETGIVKLSEIGAESELVRYKAKMKKYKHLEMLPLYLIGAGIIIILIGYLLGLIHRIEMIGNYEMEVRPYRKTKYLFYLFGISISIFGSYKYFRKNP